MNRYFFDLCAGGEPTKDETGMELGSREEIAKVIRKILLDVATDDLTELETGRVSVVARDQDGRTICVSSLSFKSEWSE